MPIYEHFCPHCGHEDTFFRPMSGSGDSPACPVCTAAMKRNYQAEGAGPHLDKEFDKPIEMHSIALCNGEDIADFRRRHPDVEIGTDPRQNDYGVPKARSRSEKLRILKKEGWIERN